MLRNSKDLHGFTIRATDGELGTVEELYFDDETWAIRYLVVETRNWWPGKHVLVSPKWIKNVGWFTARVVVDLSREEIKQSPAYSAASLPTREDEDKLHQHYDRQGYWVDEPEVKERSDKAHQSEAGHERQKNETRTKS